jgi:rhamnose utilization protein RhaD (predicted bifunctional aldolase and dehydrogenase)
MVGNTSCKTFEKDPLNQKKDIVEIMWVKGSLGGDIEP